MPIKYDPDSGLTVGATVKEQVVRLLSEGYFDGAEAAIVAVSNRTTYAVQWAGREWDCMALTAMVTRGRTQ